jgi:N4-gp56 family major capsid protein
MAINLFGDISPRTAAYVIPQLLKRGMNYLNFEKFGQSQPLPARSTMSMKFRRYESLALATTPLTEGVTPSSKKLSKTDVTMTLAQYGDLVEISDVIADTHEDPVFQVAQEVIAEQAAETVETIRYGKLKACSNKFYANGTARTDVNTAITLAKQRKITRALKRQKARMITSIIRSTENFNTENVSPGFVCACHTDCETDIRGIIDVKDYGQMTPYENEVGSVEGVRYLISNIYTPYANGGGLKAGSGTTMISTAGTSADIYPYIFLGRDAYAISALKGRYAITPIVLNPQPSPSDRLGQRGSVGWKTMQGCEILNDLWMACLEASVVELS